MSRPFTGQFTEAGIWYTDSGHRGPLESIIHIRLQGNDLVFDYEDGTRHTATGAAEGLGHFQLTGDAVQGMCFLGTQTLLLEYSATIHGRVESNVDVWTFTDALISRSGLIRQPERLIWFEAIMTRQNEAV